MIEATEGDEHEVDAEQRQGDDEEAGDGAAAHRDLDRLDEAAPGGRRRPDVGLDADEHADDPGRHRARGADQERDPGPPAKVDAVEAGVGHLRVDEGRDHPGDDHRAHEGEDPDGRVLTTDEGDGAFEDRAGDCLHLRCPGVPAQDIAGQVQREQHGDDAGRQDDQLERTGVHQVRGSSALGCVRRGTRARDRRHRGRSSVWSVASGSRRRACRR